MPHSIAQNRNLKLPPLSLYVHIPWCVKKCPYCDFNSHDTKGMDVPETDYIRALQSDFEQSAYQARGRLIQSIFIGGGTPSLFSAQSIGSILEMAANVIGLESDCEITLEANPGTFEQKKFSGYRQVGVNRLSIGIQSFSTEKLQALGRIHSSDEALNAVSIARRAGFDNINLDLMYGLPEQSEDEAMLDLEQATALKPEHISWYELTIEPNTEFFSKPPKQPDMDTLADISDRGLTFLSESGYHRYETSAFSEKGKQSRHNLNYWQFGDYLGIGAGAHGKHTDARTGAVIRQSKTRLPKHYMERIGSYVANEHEIPSEELLGEYMMNALRLVDGVTLKSASESTRMSPDDIIAACKTNIDRRLLEASEGWLKPTEQGQRLLNLCLQSFI